MNKVVHILITRDALGNQELKKLITHPLACVYEWNSFQTENTGEACDAGSSWQNKDWIVCTSPTSARLFFQKQNPQTWPPIRIACVGAKTADEVVRCGFSVDVISKIPTSKGLSQEDCFQNTHGLRILYLKPQDGRYDFYEQLKNKHQIQCFQHYKKTFYPVPVEIKAKLLDGKIDTVIFYSPSVVKAFFNTFSETERKKITTLKYYAIGPTTGEALQLWGIVPSGIAVNSSSTEILQRIFLPTKS